MEELKIPEEFKFPFEPYDIQVINYYQGAPNKNVDAAVPSEDLESPVKSWLWRHLIFCVG